MSLLFYRFFTDLGTISHDLGRPETILGHLGPPEHSCWVFWAAKERHNEQKGLLWRVCRFHRSVSFDEIMYLFVGTGRPREHQDNDKKRQLTKHLVLSIDFELPSAKPLFLQCILLILGAPGVPQNRRGCMRPCTCGP